MVKLLDKLKGELEARREELRGEFENAERQMEEQKQVLHTEFVSQTKEIREELEEIEVALLGINGGGKGWVAKNPPRRRPGTQGSTRGRPKGTGQRAQQAMEIIATQPGITIPEMAEAMGIKQNYLYRVVPELEREGKLTKSGRGWHVRA